MGALGDLLRHPNEFVPLLRMALAAKRATKLPSNPGLAFCYDMLNRVSRRQTAREGGTGCMHADPP
jgi:farnesyl-diphosphate farnesyltransferase